MGKISDQILYPLKFPTDNDYLIGTDSDNADATKTFLFSDISTYVNSSLPNNVAYTDVANIFTASQTINGLSGQGGGIGIKLENTTPTTGKTYEVLSYDNGEFAVRSTDGGVGQILRYNETTGWNFETAGATGNEDALFGGFVTVNGDLQVFGGTADYVLLADSGITFDRSNSFLKPSTGNIRNLHIGGSSSGNIDWQTVKVYTNDQDDFTWNDGIVARQNVDNNFSVGQTFQGDISADNLTINTLGKIVVNADSAQAAIEIKRAGLDEWDIRHTDNGLTFYNSTDTFKALQLINLELFSRGKHIFDAGIEVTGNVNFANLPTSPTGLSAGDLWNDSGTLKIV